MSTTFFPSYQAEKDYIVQKARELNLDPEAALAVAAHEGITLPSEVGDQTSAFGGTGSFGPWQMRDPRLPGGGALPLQIAQQGAKAAEQWTNSQQGIDYALQGIAGVAAGLHGPQAVSAIVYHFERPGDPAGETSAAITTYNQGGGPGQLDFATASKIPGAHGQPLGGIPFGGPIQSGVNTAESVVGGVTSSIDSVTKAIQFVFSYRFAEIVGGVLLILVGLVLLGRQYGASVPGASAVAARMPV